MEEKKNVFISYKTEEFDEANWVRQTLELNDISCWMAPTSIPGGSSYAEEIPKAIRNCDVFVLILSEQSQLSKWVPREVDQAINLNKVIMPFMLENCALKDDFNFYLTNVQRYEAYKNKAKEIERMIAEIKAILGAKEVTPVSSPDDSFAPPSFDPPQPQKKIVEEEKVEKQTIHRSFSKKTTILLSVILALVVLLGIVVLPKIFFKTEIAGETVNKNQSSFIFHSKKIVNEDLNTLAKNTELLSLSFSNCDLSEADLKILNNCQTLTDLKIDNCQLTDSMLTGLTFDNFTDVDFANNSLSDLSRVSFGPNLRTLNLSGNAIPDIALPRLTHPTALRFLYLNGCGLQSIEAFKECTNLVCIEIANNAIESIDILNQMSELEKLYASNNVISSIDALTGCTKLEELDISSCKIQSLKPLYPCIELSTIFAANNQLSSLDGLENATLLKYVNFNDNALLSIDNLEKSFSTLETVFLKNNKLTSISILRPCTCIRTLWLDNNNLGDLDGVEKMELLVNISATHNQIVSIKSLGNTKQLNYANLSYNRITDMSPLSNIPYNSTESYLNISNNGLTLLSPLKMNIRFLAIYNNKITDYSPLNGMTLSTLSNIILDYSSSFDYQNLPTNKDIYIKDCALDKQVSIRNILGELNTHFVSNKECDDISKKYIIHVFEENADNDR